MKYSLRLKLFYAVTALIIFYILLSLLLNNLLLEKYYFYNKKQMLLENFKLINSLYKGNPEEITSKFEELEGTKGLRIIILDKEFFAKYDSSPRGRDPRLRNSSDNPSSLETLFKSRLTQTLKGEQFIETRRDNRLNSNFIIFFSLLNNGDYIFMSTPVAAIQESVKIANRFFLFTGIITIVIGSVIVFIMTGRFIRPVLEMNEIAQRMSTLDFSRRYPVKTQDEIGQLGTSINSLSGQLQKSIYELKEANQELKEDIEKERKIDEIRKEFISSVSHELKTPVALIQGYTEGLKMNVNEDEENKNFYCDVIRDEAVKMNKLINQLLELAQMESGGLRLEKADFNLLQLIKEVLKKNTVIFKERNIAVSVKNKRRIMVNADYDKIEQVLMNYLSNAVNHVDTERIIKINMELHGRKARVSVYNSGGHIPEESLDKVWMSFYKVDKARTREYGGTGLGLSIVRAIQEAHQNGYGVMNVEGGVEFWFELDIAV